MWLQTREILIIVQGSSSDMRVKILSDTMIPLLVLHKCRQAPMAVCVFSPTLNQYQLV